MIVANFNYLKLYIFSFMSKYGFTHFSASVVGRESKGYGVAIIFIPLIYGFSLAGFPVDVFMDRVNYLNYAEHSREILFFGANFSLVYFIANEPLWLILNWVLFSIFSDPAEVVRIYIFFSAALFSFLLLRVDRRAFWLLLLFCLFPQIIKNYVIHLRQGVALSVFFSGWLIGGFRRRWLVMGLAPFIHSSFFFIIAFISFCALMRSMRMSTGLKIISLALFSICLTVSFNMLVNFSGARQSVAYVGVTQDISGLGFMFWLSILMVFFLEGRGFLKKNMPSFLVLMVYLFTYFFIPVTARIFESGLVLILVSGLALTSYRKALFVGGVIFYAILSYVIRYDQPWLGFGY